MAVMSSAMLRKKAAFGFGIGMAVHGKCLICQLHSFIRICRSSYMEIRPPLPGCLPGLPL
jgi:hypothetical protein